MRKLPMIAAVVMATACAPALAQQGGFDPQRLYFGGGGSFNEVSGSDEGVGLQIFGGYQFGEVAPNIHIDAEVGYMQTGDMEVCATVPAFGRICEDTEAKGLWATGVGRLIINPKFELLARAGLDFGDDDGFMFGIGGGYNVTQQLKLRAEYVERDEVSSVQFNVVFKPN